METPYNNNMLRIVHYLLIFLISFQSMSPAAANMLLKDSVSTHCSEMQTMDSDHLMQMKQLTETKKTNDCCKQKDCSTSLCMGQTTTASFFTISNVHNTIIQTNTIVYQNERFNTRNEPPLIKPPRLTHS